VWESRQALVGQALKRFAPAALRRALIGLSVADRAAKGLLREDAWQMLQQLGLTLIGCGGLPPYEERHGH
jgi:DNA polymerase III delta subunit